MMRHAQHPTVLVVINEGRYFSQSSDSVLYVQCRFNQEILTTDPVPHTSDPVWDTELAWTVAPKTLGFLRSQRAKLKLTCHEIDGMGRRTPLGYVILDLRAAVTVVESVDVEPLPVWMPLLNNIRTSAFRPELRISFMIVAGDGEIPQSVPAKTAPRQKPQIQKRKGQLQLSIRPSVPLSPSRTTFPQSESKAGPTLSTNFGIPVEQIGSGYYQIGFSGPNWILHISVAFAENLNLLLEAPAEPSDDTPQESFGYYFYWSFLGNDVTTEVFRDLSSPTFPAEKLSFKIRASPSELRQFLKGASPLIVHLCRDGNVIGFAEIPLWTLMTEEPGVSVDDNAEDKMDGTVAWARTRQGPFVTERVYSIFNIRQELPMSADSKLAGIGVSLILSQDEGADEKERAAVDQRREDVSEEKKRRAKPAVVNSSQPALNASLREERTKTPEPTTQESDKEKIRKSSAITEKPKSSENVNVVQSQPDFTQSLSEQPAWMLLANQKKKTAHPPKMTSINIPTLQQKPWHQYRFSIDLKSLTGYFHSPIEPVTPRNVYLKYEYAPFGSSAATTTDPPVPLESLNSGSSETVILPRSFCAFEFAMAPDRLKTYLEAVPLIVEVWIQDVEGDILAGSAIIDMSSILIRPILIAPPPQLGVQSSAPTALPTTVQTHSVAARIAERSHDLQKGELEVGLSLEDFGPIEDDRLLDIAQGGVNAGNPLVAPKPHPPPQVPPPGSPSPSSSDSMSIHDTPVYRATLELELWRREEARKFRLHLQSLERNLVNRLTAEFRARESERVKSVSERVEALKAVEDRARKLAAELEVREHALNRGEEELGRARRELNDERARSNAEWSAKLERANEDWRLRLEAEKTRSEERENARQRAVKDRDAIEARLQKVESGADELRRSVIDANPKSGRLSKGGENDNNEAMSALRDEIKRAHEAARAAEKRAQTMEMSKKQYKAQWVKALRELAKVKKALQDDAQQRLHTEQRSLETARLRLLAREELDRVRGDQGGIAELKKEVEMLRLKAASKDLQNAVDGKGPPLSALAAKENLAPKAVANAERMARERDSLIKSGYSPDDKLIRELDARIASVLDSELQRVSSNK